MSHSLVFFVGLCVQYYQKGSDIHKKDLSSIDMDAGPSDDNKQTTDRKSRRTDRKSRRASMQRCIENLVHACQCRDDTCTHPSCRKMKRVVAHSKTCQRKTTGGCPICKQLIALCCYHTKHCQVAPCRVPFCKHIRRKIKEHELQQLLETLKSLELPQQHQQLQCTQVRKGKKIIVCYERGLKTLKIYFVLR